MNAGSLADPAPERVDEIAVYIARDDPDAATRWAIELFDAVERLADFPESGRTVPELGVREVRELIFGAYQVFYCVGEAAEVLSIRRGSRLFRQSAASPLRRLSGLRATSTPRRSSGSGSRLTTTWMSRRMRSASAWTGKCTRASQCSVATITRDEVTRHEHSKQRAAAASSHSPRRGPA